jgi:hypothetical protein
MPVICSEGLVRTTDLGTLRPRLATGREDTTRTDYLSVTANGTALAANIRAVDVAAGNDDATVTAAILRFGAKGGAHGVFIPRVAAPPTWAAWMTGMLIYNNTTNQAMIATNAAWVAL